MPHTKRTKLILCLADVEFFLEFHNELSLRLLRLEYSLYRALRYGKWTTWIMMSMAWSSGPPPPLSLGSCAAQQLHFLLRPFYYPHPPPQQAQLHTTNQHETALRRNWNTYKWTIPIADGCCCWRRPLAGYPMYCIKCLHVEECVGGCMEHKSALNFNCTEMHLHRNQGIGIRDGHAQFHIYYGFRYLCLAMLWRFWKTETIFNILLYDSQERCMILFI